MAQIDKNHRVIWRNTDYEEWKEAMLQDGENKEDLTYERYDDDCYTFLCDERENLDIEVNGVIIAFADLGLWDGHHNGAKIFGTKVKNILRSENDFQDWYCDRYNVRCTDIHHDGRNQYLYRVAKDQRHAEELLNKIVYEGMTEKQFRKATRSLRPYVAEVYGW